jgi:CHAT domain-containing protein
MKSRAHLQTCEICRARVRDREFDMTVFDQLKTDAPARRSPICPSPGVWIGVAAGIESPYTAGHVNHAAQCDYCGPLLRQAVHDIADDLTPVETKFIASLPTSTSKSQREIAINLARASTNEAGTALGALRSGGAFRTVFRSLGIPIALFAVVLIAVGTWLVGRVIRANSPSQLIAQAYLEKRTIEERIEGVPYAPLRQDRGNTGDRISRPALLKAESAISDALKGNPDSVAWLQASGRASLLELDPNNALASLERANRLQEENQSIKIDLASAYILRARPGDFAQAIDDLEAVLAVEPRNEIAQFNCALALEKLSLNGRAVAAWQSFIRDHPDSLWVNEAKQHLSAFEGQSRLREQRNLRPLLSPAELSAELERDPNSAEIDARIERYQDIALEQWLPQSVSDDLSQSKAHELRGALEDLAGLFWRRHHDRWLSDLLDESRDKPHLREAIDALAEADRDAQSSNDSQALVAARRAELGFERLSIPSGVERSRFTIAYVFQTGHQTHECAELARDLAKKAEARKYEWIRIQSELEIGNCESLDDSSGLGAVEQAQRLAVDGNYPILSLRAATTHAALLIERGDFNGAWNADLAGLSEYWSGNTPSFRAYCLLATQAEIAEAQNRWHLAAEVLKEALPLIKDYPDQDMRASEQARLGNALLHIGDATGAEQSFLATRQIFEKLPVGERRDALNTEAQIGLAQAQIARGAFRAAAEQLEKIRSAASQLGEDQLRLNYFLACGIAWMHLGSDQKAELDLEQALRLAEKGLYLASSQRERVQWSRANEPLYRAIVELKLRSNAPAALAYWEWYKGASLRGTRPDSQANNPRKISSDFAPQEKVLNGSTLISYLILPEGLSVWVVDQSGIRQRMIDVSQQKLNSLVNHFLEQCSDPNSSQRELRQEGAEIYRLIFQPVEPWIKGASHIAIEPDGELRLLPFEALVDEHGAYLADRLPISISPGITYLSSARNWSGISAQSSALIVGNPEASGWTALPDSEQEARAVAAHFLRPQLLLGSRASSGEIQRDFARADVFHFSGHDSSDAGSAGLVVGNEGLFEARSLVGAPTEHAQLVVLSACSSARGTSGFYDDDNSFVVRFAASGVPEIVASRWRVDSSATSMLMQSFYDSLLGRQTVPVALELSARRLRADPRFGHPFYWAAFSAFGKG